ncbi:MAG: exodeoxyribonuclease III [Bdellovibrionales bacterium]|jgi:exodeoxyribonuclease-3|nr:exodeoxyribonuclease III [Bdellovibrionales bacterium]
MAKTTRIAIPDRKAHELRIGSWNVNGLRSVFGKGLLEWLKASDLDVVMLQEVKARPEVLETLENFPSRYGYESVSWAVAEKAGYSGLLTLSRRKPGEIREGLGDAKFDSEGRWLEVDIGDYTIINSYFPNSQREHARLPYKLEFCAAAMKRLKALEKAGRTIVLAGDINVAHTEIDLANPKTNTKNAGFLPEERAWFTSFLEAGFIDVFREFEKGPGHYTWWSYRPGVRERNVGWRLDHFFMAGSKRERANWMEHQPQVTGSDHCPIVLSVRAPSL